MEDFGTLKGGGDCQDHYHNSDRFPTRDTALWLDSLAHVTIPSASYSILPTDDFITVNGAYTITLPTAQNGREIEITSITTSPVTILLSGADTVCGETSVVIEEQWTSLRFKAITGGWLII